KQVGARHAEHGLEHLPGAPVEIFEEAAVEDNAGRVTMAPFDRQRSKVDQVRHRLLVARGREAAKAHPDGGLHRAFQSVDFASAKLTCKLCLSDRAPPTHAGAEITFPESAQ